MEKVIPLCERLRKLLDERNESIRHFEWETGMDRRIMYIYKHKYRKATLMALAYYFNMRVEDLVAGTDAEDAWYR